MSRISRTLIQLGAIALLTLPSISFAQIGLTGPIVSCSGIDCTWCSLVQMIQNLINFAIFLGIMGSALLFMYAGFLYITNQGSTENISKAKKVFMAIVWGLIPILGGWLVIDTMMRALVGQKLGPWNDFNCTAMNANVFADSNSSSNTRGIVGIDDPYSDIGGGSKKRDPETSMSVKGNGGGTYRADEHDGNDVRTFLIGEGVSFARGACTDNPNNDNCIDMSKAREYVVQQVATIKRSCSSCDVVVERGSEPVASERGLYTHLTGYTLDIKRNDEVDTFLINILTNESGNQYEDTCKNTYEQQDTVWKITVWNMCNL